MISMIIRLKSKYFRIVFNNLLILNFPIKKMTLKSFVNQTQSENYILYYTDIRDKEALAQILKITK